MTTIADDCADRHRGAGSRAHRSRPSWRRLLAGDAKVLLPLVLAIVALSIYTGTENDAFISWTNAENVMLQSSVLGIVALGQTYLIAAGQLDLSVGSLASFIGVLGATMFADGSSEATMFVTCLVAGARRRPGVGPGGHQAAGPAVHLDPRRSVGAAVDGSRARR